MLFRDPVDGVGGRPHLGVPPRHGVEAGARRRRKRPRSREGGVTCFRDTVDGVGVAHTSGYHRAMAWRRGRRRRETREDSTGL